MTLDDYFYKVKRRHPKLALHCWQILWDAECFSPTKAITLAKIRGEYFLLESESERDKCLKVLICRCL